MVELRDREVVVIVLLIGPHGAGKTTLGGALAAELGWPFHDEIGRRLAADRTHRPAGLSPERPQSAFDLAVLTEEISRDLVHAKTAPGPRLIETWHPGNIAYAARRSPRVACAMLAHARTAVDWTSVLVVQVTAPGAVLLERHTEPGSREFFREVAADTLSLVRSFGASIGPRVSTHEHAPWELARELAPRIRAVAARLRPGDRATGPWPT